MPDQDLAGRTALVSGAARGIGFAIAERLAADGARVVVSDFDAASGQEAAERLGGGASFVRADVSNPLEVDALAAAAGPVDILVNNAGIVSLGPIEDIDIAQWRRTFAVNAEGPFLTTKAFLPGMKQRRSGRIVNIASVAAHVGGGLLGNSVYAASKAAVIAFTKGIAREAGPFGVTANVVAPGFTSSAMTDVLTGDDRARVLAGMPLGHPGEPADIAAAVAFLASDGAAMITGTTLDVDGGFSRR